MVDCVPAKSTCEIYPGSCVTPTPREVMPLLSGLLHCEWPVIFQVEERHHKRAPCNPAEGGSSRAKRR